MNRKGEHWGILNMQMTYVQATKHVSVSLQPSQPIRNARLYAEWTNEEVESEDIVARSDHIVSFKPQDRGGVYDQQGGMKAFLVIFIFRSLFPTSIDLTNFMAFHKNLPFPRDVL